MAPIIEARELGFRRGSNWILRDIDWTVEDGENWVVFGLKGSGKTTLLSILSGYTACTHGSCHIFGQEPSEENILQIRQNIGFLSSSFFDKYYTKEIGINIALSGKLATLGPTDSITSADVRETKKLLSELGMQRKMHLPYHLLSKGERQLILLARALINHSKVLLLDEPCSGLDIVMRSVLLEAIDQYSKINSLSLVYVTHTLEEIPGTFNNCLILKKGTVARCGAMKDFFTDETLSSIFNIPLKVTYKDNHYCVQTESHNDLYLWYQEQ